MSEEEWHYYQADDGLFELWLPPGAELAADALTPPDETLLCWAPQFVSGVFVILRQPRLEGGQWDILDQERNAGNAVTVEVAEHIEVEGRPVRHLRYRSAKTRPREAVEDPEPDASTPAISYLAAGQIVELTEYLIWEGEKETISVGYAVDVDAPADFMAIFAQVLAGFRMLKDP
jgi:hypothetical protein